MTVQQGILYRPVGLYEAKLIVEGDCHSFPPRLPEQPFFYPVLNDAYAIQIARDWNANDLQSGYAGFVTRFAVEAEYLSRFAERVVGAEAVHRELWIPAEELESFNHHIIGSIRLIHAYYGEPYRGLPTTPTIFRDKSAWEQMVVLDALKTDGNMMDFGMELLANKIAVQLNYAYWAQQSFATVGISEAEKTEILAIIRSLFHHYDIPMPLADFD
jgi:hypothetical protein